jgi:hypothetical protein
MSDDGMPHPFEGPGAIATGLTGLKNVLVSSFSIGAEHTKAFKCPDRQNSKGRGQHIAGP